VPKLKECARKRNAWGVKKKGRGEKHQKTSLLWQTLRVGKKKGRYTKVGEIP